MLSRDGKFSRQDKNLMFQNIKRTTDNLAIYSEIPPQSEYFYLDFFGYSIKVLPPVSLPLTQP